MIFKQNLIDAVDAHIETLNAIQTAYRYERRNKDHHGRAVLDVMQSCVQSESFFIYCPWSFLEHAAKYSKAIHNRRNR